MKFPSTETLDFVTAFFYFYQSYPKYDIPQGDICHI